VLSVPLRDADETIVGSLICTGEARRLLVEPTRRFLDAAAVPVGAALASARRSEGGRCIRSMRTASKWLKSWGGWLALAGTCGVAGVLSIPMTYRIPARGELAVVERRVSVAPFEGLLLETLAAPGDVVEAGQPLARMDGREVHWELAGVLAERERAARERDTALAAHDVSRSLMAGLEVERLQTREELLRNRLDRLEVRSPLTGIVLSGSLERRENVPVDVGQALYEIAPLEALRLEVAVPAAEISHVRPGMVVEVRLAGTASEIVTGRISRIRPASELRGGRNVFIAHVELPNPDGRWRPGMEGSVRIVGDSHPLGWNLFHRAWEYLLTRVP
jgi:multidrug efflux pump subunit AcrA (membrane-fusion protein)